MRPETFESEWPFFGCAKAARTGHCYYGVHGARGEEVKDSLSLSGLILKDRIARRITMRAAVVLIFSVDPERQRSRDFSRNCLQELPACIDQDDAKTASFGLNLLHKRSHIREPGTRICNG